MSLEFEICLNKVWTFPLSFLDISFNDSILAFELKKVGNGVSFIFTEDKNALSQLLECELHTVYH